MDVYPYYLFDSASYRGCSSLIILHSHTSGRPEPSLQDMEVTMKLYEDGLAWGINLRDSVIIGQDSYYSFKETDLLFKKLLPPISCQSCETRTKKEQGGGSMGIESFEKK